MGESRYADSRSQKAHEGGAQSPAGRYGGQESKPFTNRSEQAADRPSGNFGTGHFGRIRHQETGDRNRVYDDGSNRDIADPRISFGNQHPPGQQPTEDRRGGNYRLNHPSGSDGAHSR